MCMIAGAWCSHRRVGIIFEVMPLPLALGLAHAHAHDFPLKFRYFKI